VEKKDIFLQISGVEARVGDLHKELGQLKQIIQSLLEENQRLSIENRQLRKLIKSPQRQDQPETKSKSPGKDPTVVGEGYDNLARLYYEGFHICNVYYGHLRTEGDCLFCLSFLNKSNEP
jgi:regulator of replication initiation timing